MRPTIPFHRQETNYTCGAAVIWILLGAFGIEKSEQELAELTNARPKVGVDNDQMVRCMQEVFHFDVRSVSNADLSDVANLMADGYVVIINYKELEKGIGHYAVVKSVDQKNIVLVDPTHGPDTQIDRAVFEARWYDMQGKYTRWYLAAKR